MNNQIIFIDEDTIELDELESETEEVSVYATED